MKIVLTSLVTQQQYSNIKKHKFLNAYKKEATLRACVIIHDQKKIRQVLLRKSCHGSVISYDEVLSKANSHWIMEWIPEVVIPVSALEFVLPLNY